MSQSDRSAAPSVVASVGAEYEAAAAREAENEARAGLARRLALLSQLEDTLTAVLADVAAQEREEAERIKKEEKQCT